MKRNKRSLAAATRTTTLQSQQSGLLVQREPTGHYEGGYSPYIDDAYDAPVEGDGTDPVLQPPLWLFFLGGIETAWGLMSNGFQVITSITGIIGWQQHDLIDQYGYAQAGQLMVERNLGLVLVAVVLGVGAQIGIQAFTQQISRAWKERRLVEHESTWQALVAIGGNLSMAQIIGGASFLICAFSDYLFVTQIDSSGSLGSWILMTFWALILAASSTYILTDGIQRIWSGVLALRAWRLWQDALKAHFEALASQYQPN